MLRIAERWFERRAVGDGITLIVEPHVHYDHVGSLHEFPDRAMHVLEAPRMARYAEFASLAVADFPAGFVAGYDSSTSAGDWLIDALPDPDAGTAQSPRELPGGPIQRAHPKMPDRYPTRGSSPCLRTRPSKPVRCYWRSA